MDAHDCYAEEAHDHEMHFHDHREDNHGAALRKDGDGWDDDWDVDTKDAFCYPLAA